MNGWGGNASMNAARAARNKYGYFEKRNYSTKLDQYTGMDTEFELE